MFFVRKKIWLFEAIQRIFTFLFSFQLMTFAFFLIGNYQNFLDRTQFFLLKVQKFSGILFLFFGFYTVISQFFSWYFEKKIRAGKFLLLLGEFVIGAVPVVIVYFFSMWTGTGA